MALTFQTQDWDKYIMNLQRPHEVIEPQEQEIAVVDSALAYLKSEGLLPHVQYDHDKFLTHRAAVRENFEIPWTGITPRMQRLLYAINAIHQPKVMIAAGIFCGNTFISNAGAAIGPGSVYEADDLVGIEIAPEEAARAERNVRTLDPAGNARIIAADAVEFVKDYPNQIDLLYLDADGAGGRGKGIYLDILEAGLDRIPSGSLILAHNSVNCSERLQHYLKFVRNKQNMRESINIILDTEGLEVSVR